MSATLQHHTAHLDTRETLFVGFEEHFNANIPDFPFQSETHRFEIVNNPIIAFQWLAKRVENLDSRQLPSAVFCSLTWLQNDEFRFAALLKAHPALRLVPFIVLAQRNEHFDTVALAKHGVDDCYTLPVHWSQVQKRLDFLSQFKSKLQELVPTEQYAYRLPLSKRIFDVVGASVAILLSSFFWIPIAFAIAIESKGPIIYRSKRVGARYQVFDFLKFRSMHVGAEERLFELQHLNQYNGNGGGVVFVKISRDPRVTRVGRFIRKYSLDELPQLINVLRGEMSLVGNRPLPIYEAEQLTHDELSTRFLAPAGITGLWQVTKRGQSDMSAEDRIALDVAYSKNHNLLTDLKIIMRTFKAVTQKEEV